MKAERLIAEWTAEAKREYLHVVLERPAERRRILAQLREVAAIMDVSPGTVCSRLQRGRERLRESLRKQGVRAGRAQSGEVEA